MWACTSSWPADPAAPRVRARRDGADWRLDGVKECVPAATQAAAILVPARAERGTVLLVLDPQSAGVALERQVVTSGEPQSRMTLDGARVASDVGTPTIFRPAFTRSPIASTKSFAVDPVPSPTTR